MQSRRALLYGLGAVPLVGSLAMLACNNKGGGSTVDEGTRQPLDTTAFDAAVSELFTGTPWEGNFDGVGPLLDTLLEGLYAELPQTAAFLGVAIDGLSTPLNTLAAGFRTDSPTSEGELVTTLEASLPDLNTASTALRDRFADMRSEIEADPLLTGGLTPDLAAPLLALQGTTRQLKTYARSEGAAGSPLTNSALVEVDKILGRLHEPDLATVLDELEQSLDDIVALIDHSSSSSKLRSSFTSHRDPFCDVYILVALNMMLLVFCFLLALNITGILAIAGLINGTLLVGWTSYAQIVLGCMLIGSMVGFAFTGVAWMAWDDIVAWGGHCLMGGPHP